MAARSQNSNPKGDNTMSADQRAALLYNLDVCDSIFRTLALQLENNATVADYHPLAMLAAEGAKKISCVFEAVEQAGMA